ncbi:sigma 54-interacting transcriptional regulator [Shewanella yunxiaonensis]|uniref:Sigma 54-interacting transcriptional regulator n=1 Tax=Shewanella yunxiaonensis TaxID=2829809 RepID=A0ABX7YS48_9GAMM|nr:sigma 54-interacting transcriptional regulator [Shewanella yunxiaonensis]QUN05467.1 sigma 54-interacting transcriptional regulator [Shewanella yunxiaonensis]
MSYRNKICLVAPYEELANAAERLLLTLPFAIDIYRSDLTHIVSDIPVLESRGYQVLISRGGCAELLRRNCALPLVEIKVSLFDLFDVLSPFIGQSQKIGVVGFRSVISSCKKLTEKLCINSELLFVEDDHANDMEKQILQVKQQLDNRQFDWIVGDAVYQDFFARKKEGYTIIQSSDESITKAFEDADALTKAFVAKHKESLYFQTVFNHYENSLITVNANGEVIHVNCNAGEVLGLEGKNIRVLADIDPALESAMDWERLTQGKKIIGTIVDADCGTLVINQIPMLAENALYRVMLSIQTVNNLRGMEYNVRRHELARRGLSTRYSFRDIISTNKDMLRRLQLIESYAKTDATIMIYGESGTGKEMIAQSIHNASNRSHGPFVAVNCGALAPQLLESELFGYVPGAFTGASAKGKMGLFELAHGGTIFLDEISELDKNLQSRLLRVLQERQIMRLGSDQVIPVDIRVLSASNHQLQALVKENKFREDLYYRLNILKATPLPLRDRREDIIPIGQHLIQKFSRKYNKPVIELSNELWQLLLKYNWPGNVRQLGNIIERLVLSITVSPASIDEALLLLDDMETDGEAVLKNSCRKCRFVNGSFGEIRLAILQYILQQEHYNKSRVAKRLNVDRTSINRWLNEQ